MDKYMIIRIINILLIITSIIGWSLIHRKYREPAALTPITWLVNVLCFYLFRYYTIYSPNEIPGAVDCINMWATLIITHAGLLLAFGSWLAYGRLKNNKTYMDRLKKKIEDEKKEEIERLIKYPSQKGEK